jgi:hypothetical protein
MVRTATLTHWPDIISTGRLLIISNYSATTATTIASSGGYVNTVLGSLIPLVPIFIPYVALLLLLSRHFLLSALTFVFTAFIAPTSLRFPVTRRLAAADTRQLIARIDANQMLTVAIVLLIGIVCYLYLRSIADTLATLLLLAAAIALLSAPVIQDLYLPASLRTANSGEGHIVSFSHGMVTSPLADAIHSVAVTGVCPYHCRFWRQPDRPLAWVTGTLGGDDQRYLCPAEIPS